MPKAQLRGGDKAPKRVGDGKKGQEEHEQEGERPAHDPCPVFYPCEEEAAAPGMPLGGCPNVGANSANCSPPSLAKSFGALLGALWKSSLLRRSSTNVLLCTAFVASCLVWLFSMNRKLDLHV